MRETMTTTLHLFWLPETVFFEITFEFIPQPYLNKYFPHPGNQAIVGALLKKNSDVNIKNNEGYTPLIWAAKNGYFQTKNHININAKSNYNETALLWAAKN